MTDPGTTTRVPLKRNQEKHMQTHRLAGAALTSALAAALTLAAGAAAASVSAAA